MKPLVLQRCAECDYVANFWRVGCSRCLGRLEDFEAAGKGVVMTFSIIHRWVERFEPHLPIVLAVIRLDEGVEIMSSVVGDDRLRLTIGSRVELAPEGWSEKPQFRLATAGSE